MSFNLDEVAYNRKRAAEHAARAHWCQSERVRNIHLVLASRYRELVDLGIRHGISIERQETIDPADTPARV